MSALRLHQLNDVRLVGRLTRDPELKYTAGGQAVCRLDLAVNRRYKDKSGEWKDEASYIPVVVWRESAQRCSDRLKKGSPVYVEGRLRSRSWETKEGQKRTTLEVDSRSIQFLEKVETEGGSVRGGSSGGEEEAPEAPTASVGAATDDEEIPF